MLISAFFVRPQEGKQTGGNKVRRWRNEQAKKWISFNMTQKAWASDKYMSTLPWHTSSRIGKSEECLPGGIFVGPEVVILSFAAW